ncbi:flagellar hook-length control protein FliK [Pseudomonas sp. RIT-To-2]|uniref:flagellar hook-length control protein FliK n=1 Tax=Pseudomonas sp. RIT-To-2 TaxID=3462541 RepID=UPI0024139F02
MDITALLASPTTAGTPLAAATGTDGSVFAQALDAATQAQPVEAEPTAAVAAVETAAEATMALAEPSPPTVDTEMPAVDLPEPTVAEPQPAAQPISVPAFATAMAKPQPAAVQQEPQEVDVPEPAMPLADTVAATGSGGDDSANSQLQHIRERMRLIDNAGTPDASAVQVFVAPEAVAVTVEGPVAAEAAPEATPLASQRSTNLPGITSTSTTAKTDTRPTVTQTDSAPAETITTTAVAAATATPSQDTDTSADSDTPSPQPLDTLSAWAPSATLAVNQEPPQVNTSNPTLTAAVGSSQWQTGLSQQVLNLHQRGKHQVDLQLHPADLGPLSISLKQDSSGTQAQFVCAHPAVRSAVEQALPQLREALAAQGITLGETSVSDQPSGQAQREQSAYTPPAGSAVAVAEEETSEAQATPLLTRIDLYT